MTRITVDFQKTVGQIKPMHAVGQPPFLGIDFKEISYLKEANIPYSRLHDVGGAYGQLRYVDIPNLFRDFDADENDPNSYDFTFTDLLITALVQNGCEPIFRLGVTIENFAHIKAYRIHPPKDYGKWARICEHVVRHYNEGWADGFRYGITYYEIWNEPDILPDKTKNTMWSGTKEEYYALYDVTAKHLKKCFGDTVKIGGYASSGFYGIFSDPQKYNAPPIEKKSKFRPDREEYMLDFFFGFMEYIKAHGSPLDVFTFHSYATTEETVAISAWLKRTLTEYGYGNAELQLNEWNNSSGNDTRGTSSAASHAAAMICAMQNTETDMLCYYDARIGTSAYGGMFHPLTYKPFCLYYAFKAFGHLYSLGSQTACEWEEKGIYAVSAAKGDEKAVMIVNDTEEDKEISINVHASFGIYLVDEAHSLDRIDASPERFFLRSHQVVLLKNN